MVWSCCTRSTADERDFEKISKNIKNDNFLDKLNVEDKNLWVWGSTSYMSGMTSRPPSLRANMAKWLSIDEDDNTESFFSFEEENRENYEIEKSSHDGDEHSIDVELDRILSSKNSSVKTVETKAGNDSNENSLALKNLELLMSRQKHTPVAQVSKLERLRFVRYVFALLSVVLVVSLVLTYVFTTVLPLEALIQRHVWLGVVLCVMLLLVLGFYFVSHVDRTNIMVHIPFLIIAVVTFSAITSIILLLSGLTVMFYTAILLPIYILIVILFTFQTRYDYSSVFFCFVFTVIAAVMFLLVVYVSPYHGWFQQQKAILHNQITFTNTFEIVSAAPVSLFRIALSISFAYIVSLYFVINTSRLLQRLCLDHVVLCVYLLFVDVAEILVFMLNATLSFKCRNWEIDFARWKSSVFRRN
jgi:FtsH-binding integral membrane protein